MFSVWQPLSQGQDEPSESFSKPVSESMEAEGLSNPEDSWLLFQKKAVPTWVANLTIRRQDTASTGRLLTKRLS